MTEAADHAGRPITICGEMAGDPQYTNLLLASLRRFSVSPGEISGVKCAIRAANLSAANALAQRVLAMRSVAEVERCSGFHLADECGRIGLMKQNAAADHCSNRTVDDRTLK